MCRVCAEIEGLHSGLHVQALSSSFFEVCFLRIVPSEGHGIQSVCTANDKQSELTAAGVRPLRGTLVERFEQSALEMEILNQGCVDLNV